MNTVIVVVHSDSGQVGYVNVKGDYRHLDRLHLDARSEYEDRCTADQDELYSILYADIDSISWQKDFPVESVKKHDCAVITVLVEYAPRGMPDDYCVHTGRGGAS